MSFIKMMILVGIVSTGFACKKPNFPPLTTAKYVDVNQYLGKWYAQWSLPMTFTRDCKMQTAEYGLIDGQTISVLNTCYKGDGVVEDIKGHATVVDHTTNAKLIVEFDNFWTKLFRVKGDYTIIELAEDYSWVMVGSQDRKSLWILTRELGGLSEAVKNNLFTTANNLGFNTQNLIESVKVQ